MKTQSLTVFGGFKTLLLSIAGFFAGLWLSKSQDQIMLWIGIALSSFAGISAVIALSSMTSSSLKQARQYRFSIHSHSNSGVLGDAKLADENSAVIQKLTRNRNGLFLGAYKKLLLFFDPFATGNAHWIVYARARSGKTSSVITPTALQWMDGSLILPSIKGDTVAIARRAREEKGHRVLIWNPFEVLEITGLKFNPLNILVDDAIENNGQNLQGYALLLAKTMIPKSQNEENPFFRNGAVRLLAGFMIFLAVIRPWQCHLPGLNKLVWESDDGREEIVALMQANDQIGGLVKKYGNHLSDLFKPEYVKTFGPMRDYAIDATMIYDSGTDFGKSLMGDDFDLKTVLDERTTFFPILPEEKLVPFGQSIGLIMALMFEHIAALKNPAKILVVLDEAGNFGKIPNVSRAMTLLPEKGLRVVKAYQSRNQLVELYGENDATNIEKQCSGIQEWAISDLEAAKRWSTRCGNKTVKTQNMQFNPSDPINPWKPSVSETSHPVLNVDQVLTLPANEQLIAVNGEPVIAPDLVTYFEVEEWRKIAEINPYHPGGYPIDKPVKYTLV